MEIVKKQLGNRERMRSAGAIAANLHRAVSGPVVTLPDGWVSANKVLN